VPENPLAVETRQITGKGHARKLRAAGRIPAVCYSSTMEATPLQVDPTADDRSCCPLRR
jgi:ribosomal protein L25 (general stress protein Ctc)